VEEIEKKVAAVVLVLRVNVTRVGAVHERIDSCRPPLYCFNHTTVDLWTSSAV